MARRSVMVAAATVLIGLAVGCTREESSAPGAQTQRNRFTLVPYDRTFDGQVVEVITLRTPDGPKAVEMKVLTYGGIIQSLSTRDSAGAADDIVMGFDSLADYTTPGKSPVLRLSDRPLLQPHRERACSRSTARPTRSRRTTTRIICTAAFAAGTR